MTTGNELVLRLVNIDFVSAISCRPLVSCSTLIRIQHRPPLIWLTSHPVGAYSAETDLGMFRMFARTGVPQKGGPHRPEKSDIVEQSLDCGAYSWRDATVKSSLGTARHSLARGWSVGVLRNLKLTTLLTCLFHGKFLYINVKKIMWGPPHFTEQCLIGFKSGPDSLLRNVKRSHWVYLYNMCKNIFTLACLYTPLAVSVVSFHFQSDPGTSAPPRTPFGHIWALIWSGVRGNIARTAR